MKTNKKITKYSLLALVALSSCLSSCDDFLDQSPKSSVSPEGYYTSAAQLGNDANGMYESILTWNATWNYGADAATDNQTGRKIADKYTPDLWLVGSGSSSGDSWSFNLIYRCNYFFSQVLPKFGTKNDGSENKISGDLASIKHYIGEVYFLRAYNYFQLYQEYGDFPIITTPLPAKNDVLRKAMKRMPRNEVARFILTDLDKAVALLGDKDFATTRINKDVALLFKSRVALFEGTWLKYYKGTAFVPNGQGWPGKAMAYNKDFKFKAGSIDSEIDFFLTESMNAAKLVAEKYKNDLTANTGVLQQDAAGPKNPYYEMFAQENLSKFKEVLLWRQYAPGLKTHNNTVYIGQGNEMVGVTRGYVNNYLMKDGTPVYLHGTYADGDGFYKGDKTISDVRVNRDSRLSVFLKEPGQTNILYELDNAEGTEAVLKEPNPMILDGDFAKGYGTGYSLRKGAPFNKKYYKNDNGYIAEVCFRATEALLNYMEASYLEEGKLDNLAIEYWKKIRERAHVSTDIQNTIDKTVMSKEAPNDWGAYSAGKLLSDRTLYNIRRERRDEFIGEGFRDMDLHRWRAMDQLISTPYHIEGFHLWNTPMEHWYDKPDGSGSMLIADGTKNANVSPESRSEYLRPFERMTTQNGYDGMTWRKAYYLSPIGFKHLQLSSTDPTGDISKAVLYQNPYWPAEPSKPAEQ